MKLLFWLWKKRCRHLGDTGIRTVPEDMSPLRDYKFIRQEFVENHIGWDGRLHKMSRSLLHCNLCGEDWWTPMGYMPGEDFTDLNPGITIGRNMIA